MCTFSLACNERYKSKSGEQVEKVAFLEAKCWGKRGESIAQYFKKGKPIFVEGKLEQEKWIDKTSGQERSRIVVNVSDWQFVESKAEAGRAPQGAEQSAASNINNSDMDDEAILDASQGVPF